MTLQIVPEWTALEFWKAIFLFTLRAGQRKGAPRRGATDRLRNNLPLDGEKEIYLYWIAFQILSNAPPEPRRSKQLMLKTAESHRPGGQPEP